MGTISDKLTYLNTTKNLLKTQINYGLPTEEQITSNTTFRNYVSSLFEAFLESLRTPDTLFTNLPKKSGSGSNITLNDTANAPMRIMLNATDITQDGTPTPSSPQDIHTISGDNTLVVSGKNLFNNIANTITFNNITMTNNGKQIKFTGTNDSSFFYPAFIFYADGSITTDNWHPTSSSINSSKGYFNESGIAYVLSLLKTGTFDKTQCTYFVGRETTMSSDGIYNNTNTYTKQIASNSEKINFIGIGFQPSQTLDITLEIQLEKGSTATTYQPYISQEAEVDLKSKNLFNKNGTLNSGYLGSDGSVVSSSNYKFTDYLPIKPNTYYATIGMTTGTGNAPSRCYYDENKNFIIGYAHLEQAEILNASPSNAFYMRESVKIADYDTTKIYQAPYYDYGEYSKMPNTNYKDQFIRNSGKNEYDINTNPLENSSTTRVRTTGYISLKAGTHTISYTGANKIYAVYYNSNNTKIGETNWTTGDLTFTFNQDYKYVFYFGKTGDATITASEVVNVMLNEGSTALPYEPYGLNKWYIKKAVPKIESYNGETITTTYMSTTGGLDTGATVYYGTNTPTYTKITGTLAEQLEYVYQLLKSYKGVTNISQVNNDLPFELDVQAIEDME